MSNESFDTIVVGGGQAGLAAGYHLAKHRKNFIILDKEQRAGDAWRKRWDSLRLFTPSQFNSLPGMTFPKPINYFPTKDEVSDYLEEYVEQFQLPMRHNMKVDELKRGRDGYDIVVGTSSFHARHVIVATGPYQVPHVPSFARELDPSILQIHSSSYCNPSQIPAQSVLVVGAGNSGAEIALDLVKAGKRVRLAGRDVGKLPVNSVIGKIFGGRLFWFIVNRVLSVETPIGRKMRERISHHGVPLGHAHRERLAQAGIELVPRMAAVRSGQPQLEDRRVLPVKAVIWATGFQPDFSWINLPIFDENGYPRHVHGTVPEAPGLYFVGLLFQRALSSALLGGVGADAAYIVEQLRHYNK